MELSFIPWDGSSNVDANIPTGTIIDIFQTAECEVFHENDEIFKDAQQTGLENTLQQSCSLKGTWLQPITV
jgi:fructose-1,6-bisphosphatase